MKGSPHEVLPVESVHDEYKSNVIHNNVIIFA